MRIPAPTVTVTLILSPTLLVSSQNALPLPEQPQDKTGDEFSKIESILQGDTCLENVEMLENFTCVREMSEKSCHGKLCASSTSGIKPVFTSVVHVISHRPHSSSNYA